MVLGNDGGDDIESFQHVHRLGLDDGHKYQYAPSLEIFDGSFHSIESRLVYETDKFHTDDDHFGMVGDVLHDLFEFVDGSKEDGAVETLDEDVLAHFVGDAALIAPGDGFVEVGEARVWQAFAEVGRGHGRRAVAALDEVAGTFHKEDAGDDHANADSGEEVDKDGDKEDDDQNDSIGFGNLEEVFEALEVDNAPADGDKDTGKDGKGNIFNQATKPKEDGKEEEGMDHTADLCASATLDIDNGTHGGAGTRKAAEKSGNGIADALADEFLVAVVLGFGDVVGHNGGEQCVNGAKTCQSETRNNGGFEDTNPVDGGKVDA